MCKDSSDLGEKEQCGAVRFLTVYSFEYKHRLQARGKTLHVYCLPLLDSPPPKKNE